MKIKIFTTGGTIDKVYFDAKSTFEVGESQIGALLAASGVTFEYEIQTLMRKDSLDMTPVDRQLIRDAVVAERNRQVLVTHGTDTMVQTARLLLDIPGKTIVFTGSMQPARFHMSDASFNIGCAVAAVQTLPDGVFIAMNGRVLHAANARKNHELNRFEAE